MKFRVVTSIVAVFHIFVFTLLLFAAFGNVPVFAGTIGENCTVDEFCTNTTENTYCSALGKCTCSPGYLFYNSTDKECGTGIRVAKESCLKVAYHQGERCSVDDQCTLGSMEEFSHCHESACRCMDNATVLIDVDFGDYCVPLAKNLGESCGSRYYDLECRNIPYAACLGRKCSCEVGRVPSVKDSNVCILGAKHIGDSCEKDDAICATLPNTNCDITKEKTCQCLSDSYVPAVEQLGCVEMVKELGKPCNESVQCQMDKSWCVFEEVAGPSKYNGTCTCLNGYIESTDNPNTCIQIQKRLNATCAENIQCTSGLGEHAECGPSGCVCKDNGLFHNEQCYQYSQLGQSCLISEQCKPNLTGIPYKDLLTCEHDHFDTEKNVSVRFCRCNRNTHRELNGVCFLITGYGMKCGSDDHCKASSSLMECDTGTRLCRCPKDYMVSSGREECIVERVGLGEKCEESRQCKRSDDDVSQLCNYSSGTCACKKGYYSDEGGNTCKKSGSGASTVTFNFSAFFVIFAAKMFKNIF